MEHEYSEEGIFTVKIYGKKYFAIKGDGWDHKNLMCGVFRSDLPVASHLTNFSSFCYDARMLLYVDVENSNFITQASNVSNTFYACMNMLSAEGFPPSWNIDYCGNIFSNCYGLTYTDFKLPPVSSLDDYQGCFERCWSLKNTIESLLAPNK